MSDQPSDDAGSIDSRAADRLLRRASRHGRGLLAAMGATALMMAAAETILPAALGRAVDSVVGQGSSWWIAGSAALIAVLVASDMLDDLVSGTAAARSTAWLRHQLTRQLLDLGWRPGRLEPGDAATRMTGNAAMAGQAGPDVVRGVANLIPAVGGIVALALIDPWLCVAFVSGLPLLLIVLRTVLREASSMAGGYLASQAGIAQRLAGALSGARTIAAAGTASREADRILAPLPDLRRYGLGMWRAQMRVTLQDALLLPLLEIVVLGVAGYQLAKGRLTPGQVLAAGQYVQLASTIGSASGAVTRLARARAGAARVAEVLDSPTPTYGTASLPSGDGHLQFRDVTARVGDHAVLDRLNLIVPGGSMVAVVGRSGSGKSLLAALAGRLTDPHEGVVLLDGVPLSELSHGDLREAVVYGFERPGLLGHTVVDAIAFGHVSPSREEVVAAAYRARADDFIRHLPAGYDTPLAEAPMSGGEAQRMGLARTFAHGGRVIVLDDVTASLDSVTEHEIGRILTGRLGNVTRLVVAHRASTASRADVVAWLDGGQVRALAPHALLWADPAYRALFDGGDVVAGAAQGAA